MKLVLIRHGESEWNKLNLFTGWTDVGLSEKGEEEAHEAGKLLKDNNYSFDIAYTSSLKGTSVYFTVFLSNNCVIKDISGSL